MTHEEAVVQLVRTEVTSYKQLPLMVYQIQTKYRDEARPRAGMIRVREFTMKDAYSFHSSQEDLEAYYKRAHAAYERIFQRIGIKNAISIESNSGMMGGKVSHEFMAICDCGEDTIFTNSDYSYRANREIAVAAYKFEKSEMLPLEKVHTPGTKTIEDVAKFLNVKAENTAKAVFYQDVHTNELIFALVRGDFEINETKLQNLAKVPELKFADDASIESIGCVAGYASILNIDPAKVRIFVDDSVAECSNLVVGANEHDYHYINFNFDRDVPNKELITIADIKTVRAGDPCPVTGEPLIMTRGIEIGNIFQLGTKYSEAMNCTYLDRDGKSQVMIMGCYGIGVGRSMAAVLEQSCDDYGPIWPITIAPYQIHICAIQPDKDGVKDVSDKLYEELQAQGIEVIYDDRGEKPGFMFNDADLLGVPFRVIISPKTLADNEVEFKIRGEKDSIRLPLTDLTQTLVDKVKLEIAKY
jgi:prolyl-tRNA synthetase